MTLNVILGVLPGDKEDNEEIYDGEMRGITEMLGHNQKYAPLCSSVMDHYLFQGIHPEVGARSFMIVKSTLRFRQQLTNLTLTGLT